MAAILIRPLGDSITYGFGFEYDSGHKCEVLNQDICMPPSSTGGGYRGFMTLYAIHGAGIQFTTEGYQSGGAYVLQWRTNTQTHDGYPGYRTDYLIPISKYPSFANYTLIHIGTNDMVQSLQNAATSPTRGTLVATEKSILITIFQKLLKL